MANGDSLRVGLEDNRASASTLLITDGSPFGDPRQAFWILRQGAPTASSAILAQNLSPADPTSTHAGVIGQVMGAGNGVMGAADGGAGVAGNCPAGVGVIGTSTQGLAGVFGTSDQRSGVHGESVSGWGVSGSSTNVGALGESTGNSATSIGVVGICDSGTAVFGTSLTGTGVSGRSQSGLAGWFVGDVLIQGAFTVVGGTKSVVVRHRDGSYRTLYCIESPENFFEDFGEAKLVAGSTKVKLDAEFAALVKRSDYQVFLTSYSPAPLYVKRRTPQYFEIAVIPGCEPQSEKVIRCGYRIVAKRADIRATRLAKAKLKTVTPVPKAPDVSGAARVRSTPFPKASALPRFPSPPNVRLADLPKMQIPSSQTTKQSSASATKQVRRRKVRQR